MSDSPTHENEDDYDDEEMDEEQAEVYDSAMVEDDANTSSDESLLETHVASDAMVELAAAHESPSTNHRNNLNYTQETVEADYEDHEDEDDDDVSKDHGDLLEDGVDEDEEDLVVSRVADERVDETNDDTSLEEGEEDENEEMDEKLEAPDESKDDSAPASKNQKPEATSYSTRGRAQEENHLDRLAAVGDLLALGGNRDAATAALLQSPETKIRESFLSDSLTEEERRTRTRYIPAVDGMHALRKQEIKSDLALARAMQLVNGASEKVARSKRKLTEDDASGLETMDSAALSGEDAIMSNEEDKSAGGATTKTVEIGTMALNVPSSAFVAPTLEGSVKRSTPREVDVVVAFNPPRPPESVGAKKKHRMLRWERRPSDIEVDLSNYRKTVQKTREELKSAEGELERIRVVDNQLRRHFLQHIHCMNLELQRIGEEIATVQQECVDMADLPSSRTRTRGAFKGANAMKDVLHALRAKGKEIEAKGIVLRECSPETSKVYGAGGVSASSFVDWDRSTSIESGKLAEAWIVPGDTVNTPYGVGTVRAVYGPSVVNVSEVPNTDLFPKTSLSSKVGDSNDAMELDETENPIPSVDDTTSKKKTPKISKVSDASEAILSLKNLLAPRVAVQLPFGVAFFNLNSVRSDEDVSRYTDDQLAKRWFGIAETAAQFGACINVSAMANVFSKYNKGEAGNFMDTNESENEPSVVETSKERLVPFGAGMLPTAVGRGNLLHKAIASELDEAVDKAFFKGYGVLGMKDNTGVPNKVRELEDQRQEHLNLKAKVLQLRNQLYRQRRIRLLNEKTYASSQERSSRVESLVAEMRLDLKNLKGRLDLEIRDFGISEEQAEGILKAFYTSQDSQHAGDPSSPSRPRRFSSMKEEDVEGQDSSDIPLSMVDTETSAAE